MFLCLLFSLGVNSDSSNVQETQDAEKVAEDEHEPVVGEIEFEHRFYQIYI
jgi:hypothetical protein